MTLSACPQDRAEGTLLWAKIAILFLVSMLIPLITPRQYVPFDPKVVILSQVFGLMIGSLLM